MNTSPARGPGPAAARRLLLFGCTLLLAALLAGCSSTRLAYSNADWLLQRGAARYLDLEREQSRALREALQGHLAWHCAQELPRYVAWLERSERILLTAPVDAAALQEQLDEAQAALALLTAELTPTVQWLLNDLSPAQRAQLAERLTARQAELREEYLLGSADAQAAARAERMERRLRRWLGRLDDGQRRLLDEWSAARGAYNRDWLDNRERWQHALLAALELEPTSARNGRIAELLQQPERLHSEAWAARQRESREAAVALAVALLETASDGQRRRLQGELTKLRRDLRALSCDDG